LEGAPFKKNQGAASGSVVNGKTLDVENISTFQFWLFHSKAAHLDAFISG
jgi:hypothetical protein